MAGLSQLMFLIACDTKKRQAAWAHRQSSLKVMSMMLATSFPSHYHHQGTPSNG
jgi:hypothetical protein